MIIFLFLLSCNNSNNELRKLNMKLEKENDSLIKILNEINTKYVFDSIAFRDIYSKKNTYKLGSEFEVELLIVAYNHNQSFFVKYDSIDADGKLINPDTIHQKNGGFKIKTILDKKINPIKIDMQIKNKYGRTKRGKLFDNIIVK